MKKLLRNKILSVGLIGLGKIGMGLDLNQISSKNVFKSHIKSFYFNDKFKLEFVLDNDKSKLKVAKKNYKKINKFYDSIDQIKFLPQIIVLACDEKTNLKLFNKLKDNPNIRFFFVEKPFRLNNNFDYKNYENKIIINYIRKFTPFYTDLKKNISDNIFGDLLSIDVKYSKGIDNTVSHFVDLLFYLFGNKIKFDDINLLNKPKKLTMKFHALLL
jgi:predicted dehydrogenase